MVKNLTLPDTDSNHVLTVVLYHFFGDSQTDSGLGELHPRVQPVEFQEQNPAPRNRDITDC
jgi:hypothetical protein